MRRGSNGGRHAGGPVGHQAKNVATGIIQSVRGVKRLGRLQLIKAGLQEYEIFEVTSAQ